MIQEWEIKAYLSKDDIENIEKLEQLNLIKQNSKIIECSCGSLMEVAPG